MKTKSTIPLNVWTNLPHLDRLKLYAQVEASPGIERFLDLDVLRALVMWNDSNGDYDHCTRADFCDIIQAWRAEEQS